MKDIRTRLAELKATYETGEAVYSLVNEILIAFKNTSKTNCKLDPHKLSGILDKYDFVIRNKAMEELRNMGFYAHYSRYDHTWELYQYSTLIERNNYER